MMMKERMNIARTFSKSTWLVSEKDEAVRTIMESNNAMNDLSRAAICGLADFIYDHYMKNDRRHRHWESHEGDLYCSSCGRVTFDRHDELSEFEGRKIIALKRPYYCSYCGRRMDEEADDD